MKKLLILFSIILSLFACEKKNEVVFEEAQPNTSDDEVCFRKNIQGKYIYPKDSSLIIITDSTVKKVMSFKWVFSKNDIKIDSASQININDNNSIISALKNDGVEACIIGDTIFGKSTYIDTIFKISEDDKLRFFKGHYFLNSKIYDKAYHVLRMEVSQKKFLRFSKIEPYETLEKYEDITPINKIRDDSGRIVQYNLKPTRKELKRLMNENAFLYNEEVYVRVKN